MRSIRLSLIVYFLLLLGAALGAVSYYCYESTQEALVGKEKSDKELWKKQFEENKAQRIADFNDRLVAQARSLASQAALYHDRLEMLSVGLGILASQPHNGGPVAALAFWMEAINPENAVILYRPHPPTVLIDPHPSDDLHPFSDLAEGHYYQTYAVAGKGQQFVSLEHSRSLGGFVWKLEKDTRNKADERQIIIDDVKLPWGQTVRRVTMRFTVNASRRGLVVEPKLNDKGPDWSKAEWKQAFGLRLPEPGETRTVGFKGPVIYLQYGADTSTRDKAIAELRDKLNIDLAELENSTAETLAGLRTRLLWIGLGTFAALVLGGFWLIRLGLKPLNRLTEALSKVSEKDFRLPIDQSKIPGELQPIATRFSETLEQLKRAFEREKQAAADISHELRTPVAALLTTLDITLRKPRPAEEYREILETCRHSGQQINQLVERLLTLARLDAGADMLRPRDVDVAALADQCVALVRPLAEARGLQLRVHHDGPASMHADPDKLREVLNNLLHNAIEYNKPNGSIDVQVQRSNGMMAMEVRDTGIGLSPQAQKRVFERFYRVDPSRHADAPHTGLGLAIVKGYVDLMGGAIDVESAVGVGTTFRVRLPTR